jgi:uncharacterized protein YdiU (UPF0061 family)
MHAKLKPGNLSDLCFDNSFTRELPADPITENYRREVTGACYSRVMPMTVTRPQLVAYAQEVAELIDLSPALCVSDEFAAVFAGDQVVEGMDPFAMVYGGHQFGHWAGQLGDGRAINLGEVINHAGERWVLQLKGAGQTPYSRSADGLAVLRSSIREFLCSEAMHHLGVPTTRALSLVTTGEEVVRDMFYDGHPIIEPGAVVCRVSPSFIRFGSFQIFAARGETDLLRKLVDYTIRTDFPHLGEPSPEIYLTWFREVCSRTAKLMVAWWRVGFVHGVMNTDNMSILGLTIDYGPYGWLEDFDPGWTPNTTDAEGKRYRFGAQAEIAQWNLFQLANAILPLVDGPAPLEQALVEYAHEYEQGWREMMAHKLGLQGFAPETDAALTEDLLSLLSLLETDITIFFRNLADVPAEVDAEDSETDLALVTPLLEAYYAPDRVCGEALMTIAAWLRRYRARVRADGTSDAARRKRMHSVNPKYVLRNYLAQLAIDAAESGDNGMVNELLELLRRPYDEQPGMERFAEKRPEWARNRAGCSMLSCSS